MSGAFTDFARCGYVADTGGKLGAVGWHRSWSQEECPGATWSMIIDVGGRCCALRCVQDDFGTLQVVREIPFMVGALQ